MEDQFSKLVYRFSLMTLFIIVLPFEIIAESKHQCHQYSRCRKILREDNN